MANIYSLQLLRNGSPFSSYTAAVDAITSGSEQDGVIKLARYTSDSETSGTAKYNTATIKTIFGIRHSGINGESGWTIFDSYHEVIADLQLQIDAMGGGAGSIAQQIEAALDQLDFSGVTGNVVTGVEQTNGKVTATGANVGTLALTGYKEGTASGHVEATDSINDAFAKLQNQIDAANDAKDAAIADLDYTDTAVTGSYVSKVDEANGVISVTREALPTVAAISEAGKPITAVSESLGAISASAGTINAEYVNVADSGNLFTASTVEGVLAEIDAAYKAADEAIVGEASTSGNTLGKLEDRIEALDADAATYTVKKVTTGLDTNVKEQYVLVETKNGVSTDKDVAIPIYKDNTLKSVELVDQALQFTYIVDSGESVVSVDVSKFLADTEFGSGVTANSDGYVHGVVDTTSETFLTVGANGFKLAGVQAAIDAASGDVKSKLDELSGKTVTGIDMTGGTAAIANNTDGTKKITINADGSTLSASTNYTSAQTASAVAAGDSIDTALGKLEAQVAAARAAATTKVEKDANASHITLTSNTAADGSVTYTIGEHDIASATALTAEIAARKAVDGQTGQTYAANANTNYISGATDLNDADVKLDAALKTVADSANSAQTEIDAIETAVGLNANGTHAQSAGNYTSGANSIEGEIVALDTQVKANADAIEDLQDSYISGITMNGSGVTVTNNVAAMTATYTNTAADSENGMVITTDANGGLTFQFGTLDCGEY